MPFGSVAFLTGCNDVAFGAPAAPGDGHNMVHGQFFGGCRATAVVADTSGAAPLPPLRIAEFSGLAPFPVHLRLGQIICKRFHFSRAYSLLKMNGFLKIDFSKI